MPQPAAASSADAADAYGGIYPSVSLGDALKSAWTPAAQPPTGSAAAAQPEAASSADAYGGIYPSVSLGDALKSALVPAAQQTTYVPRPPSTYTPAEQPYVPPSNQAYAPHPPSTYTPSGQSYPAPASQQAYGAPSATPQTATATAAPPPADPNPAADTGVYPQQTLFDIFSKKSQ